MISAGSQLDLWTMTRRCALLAERNIRTWITPVMKLLKMKLVNEMFFVEISICALRFGRMIGTINNK